jgi:hypothetical protein
MAISSHELSHFHADESVENNRIRRDAYIALSRLCDNYAPLIRFDKDRQNYAEQLETVTGLLIELTENRLTVEEKKAGSGILRFAYPESDSHGKNTHNHKTRCYEAPSC